MFVLCYYSKLQDQCTLILVPQEVEDGVTVLLVNLLINKFIIIIIIINQRTNNNNNNYLQERSGLFVKQELFDYG